MTCRLGKRDLSNVLASILNGPAEVQEKPVVPTTAYSLISAFRRRLSPLHRRTSPFAPGPVPAGEIRWVTPKLVAQIGFGEWTEAGLLRHPRYLGLRDDKAAREVRREDPGTGGGSARRRGGR